jgi:hypothetical protein
VRPYLEKPITKKDLVEWLKEKALSSNSTTAIYIYFFPFETTQYPSTLHLPALASQMLTGMCHHSHTVSLVFLI